MSDLSVLLIVPGPYAAMEQTVEHLRRQTVKERLELVFVVRDLATAGVPQERFEDFAGLQVLEFGPIEEMGEPLARAVREARSPLVVTAEDHCFPDPDWAEQLILAHAGPYAAVGPQVLNGNPERLESWVNLLLTHGAYTGWDAPREMDHLPGYNTSYKREALLEFGDELGQLLNFEILLCQRLQAAGHRLLLYPAARVSHHQWSYPLSLVVTRFICMRSFAAARSASWSPGLRLVYGLGSPLLPLVKLRQMLPDVLRTRRSGGYWPQILPYLLVALLAGAAGEAAGYLLGEGGCDRLKLVLDSDREKLPSLFSG